MALVQLEILNQLEKVTGKRIVDLFEWIVASGVSGFLMMAMVYGKHASNDWPRSMVLSVSANKSIAELRRIYFCLRERVFSGQEPAERGRELERFAVEIFSNSKRMSDVIDVDAPK